MADKFRIKYKDGETYEYIGFKKVKRLLAESKLQTEKIYRSIMISARSEEFLKSQGVALDIPWRAKK